MRQLLGLTAVAVLLASCNSSTSPYGSGGGGGGGGCTPTATQVCMVGTSFSPASLTVAAGTAVTWLNGSALTHTATSSSSSTETFNSGIMTNGQSFSHTFATKGTYHYFCTYHGVDGNPPTGMAGIIIVQ